MRCVMLILVGHSAGWARLSQLAVRCRRRTGRTGEAAGTRRRWMSKLSLPIHWKRMRIGPAGIAFPPAATTAVEILDDSTYAAVSRTQGVWLNRLSRRCRGLSWDMIPTVESHGSRVCEHDRFRGRPRSGSPTRSSCTLGKFEKIDEAQVESLRAARGIAGDPADPRPIEGRRRHQVAVLLPSASCCAGSWCRRTMRRRRQSGSDLDAVIAEILAGPDDTGYSEPNVASCRGVSIAPRSERPVHRVSFARGREVRRAVQASLSGIEEERPHAHGAPIHAHLRERHDSGTLRRGLRRILGTALRDPGIRTCHRGADRLYRRRRWNRTQMTCPNAPLRPVNS